MRHPWAYLLWIVVGGLLAFGFAGILTVGIFVIPIALVLGVIGLIIPASRSYSVLSCLIGMGAVAVYLAWLNRGGPGTVCESRLDSLVCVDQWSPWPFLAAGVALILTGIWLPLRLSRAARSDGAS